MTVSQLWMAPLMSVGLLMDCLTCVGAFQSPAFSYTSIYPSAAVKARHTTDPILRRGASRSGVGALVGLAPRTASLRVVTHKSLPGLSFTDDQGAGKEEAGALFHRGRRSLRTVASAERLAEGAAWSALEDWAKGKGMTWSSWKVGEVNGIRGAVATQNIEAGHILVKAPLASVLMVSEGDSCPLPSDFIDPLYWDEISEYWNLRMALRLLYEKRLGEKSSWKAYLDVMPTSFTTPLNWSDEEVSQLQFAPFVDELQVERSFFGFEAERLRRHMPVPVSKEEVFWGLSCAGSRTFTADFGDGPAAEAMCPIADMVNHNEASAPAFRWDEDEEAFELFSPLSLREGEEVCISYGEVNNAHLLHYYGFVPASNAFDSVPITEKEIQAAARQLDNDLGEASDAMAPLRNSVLKYLVDSSGGGLTLPLRMLMESWSSDKVIFSSDEDGHTFEIGLEGNMPLAFVIYCRVWAITQADTEGPGGGWTLDALGLAKILQSGRDVSSEHGKRWRQLATIALQSQLAGLPTSLDDDAAMLSAMEAGGNPGGWEGPTDNLMQAVRFRMGHKKILLDTIASLASF